MPKTYRTVIRLGAESDTLDADGRVTKVMCRRPPHRAEVELALTHQVGAIVQRPPAVSALKVQGERAYDLARSGRVVELAPRLVHVGRIDLIGYEWPRLELEIDCGSGTYIRSIARDVGAELGCGGLVEVLTRTRIGPFTLAGALDPDTLSAATIAAALRPAREAVTELPSLSLTAVQVKAIIQGQDLSFDEVSSGPTTAGEIALYGPDGALVAIAEYNPPGRRIQPRRVLATG
jgi:tRNA pseudouridine55 synthase